MRPAKNEAKVGIVQCKDAIMNSLGKFSKQVFLQMEQVLQCMVTEEEQNVLIEAITERIELGEIVDETDLKIVMDGKNKKDTKENNLPFEKAKNVKNFDIKSKKSQFRFDDCTVDFVDSMISRLEQTHISDPSDFSSRRKSDLNLRKANKALLGKLFDDQVTII